MDKIYYVERKTYYLDANLIEHQIADGGELPMLYLKRERAIKRAKNIVTYWTTCSNYIVTIPNETHPAVKDACIYATRCERDDLKCRCEVRVYEMELEDAFEVEYNM